MNHLFANRSMPRLIIIVFCCLSTSQFINSMENPVFTAFNEAIAFHKLSAEKVIQAKDETMQRMDNGLKTIYLI